MGTVRPTEANAWAGREALGQSRIALLLGGAGLATGLLAVGLALGARRRPT